MGTIEETLTRLHDLFATLRKECKQFIRIVEPMISHPNNDYERMLIRKSLGFEKDRSTKLKQAKKEVHLLLEQETFEAPLLAQHCQMIADVKLEQFKVQLFKGHVEDAHTLNANGEVKAELTEILNRISQQESELGACLTELEDVLIEAPLANKATASPVNQQSQRTLSVGSLIGQE